jgi:hypothetical protein
LLRLPVRRAKQAQIVLGDQYLLLRESREYRKCVVSLREWRFFLPDNSVRRDAIDASVTH